jgi:membrane protease YdiL (CAAX protease family)
MADASTSPRRRPLRRLLAFLLLLCVGAALFTGLWIGLGLPPQRQHGVLRAVPQLLSGVLVLGLALVVTAGLVRRLEGRGLDTVGLARDRSAIGWPIGLLLGGAAPLAVTAAFLLSGHAELQRAAPSAAALLATTIPMALGVLMLSAWEEIGFRGYPLQLLAEWRGPRVAALLTGIVFGLLHAGNPGANPAGLTFTAMNGALLGWVVIRTGSLWLATGYHGGWNLMAAVVLGLRDSGAVHEGSLVHTDLTGPPWITGGGFGFEASPVTALIELAVLLLMLRWGHRFPGNLPARAYFAGRVGRPAGDGISERPVAASGRAQPW